MNNAQRLAMHVSLTVRNGECPGTTLARIHWTDERGEKHEEQLEAESPPQSSFIVRTLCKALDVPCVYEQQILGMWVWRVLGHSVLLPSNMCRNGGEVIRYARLTRHMINAVLLREELHEVTVEI